MAVSFSDGGDRCSLWTAAGNGGSGSHQRVCGGRRFLIKSCLINGGSDISATGDGFMVVLGGWKHTSDGDSSGWWWRLCSWRFPLIAAVDLWWWRNDSLAPIYCSSRSNWV